MSSVPQSKEELIQAIEKSYTKLNKRLDSIGEREATLFILEGQVKNTQVSMCNLLAYLCGWADTILPWFDLKNPDKTQLLPQEYSFAPKDLGRLALKFYDDYKEFNFLELQEILKDRYVIILEQLNKKSNKDLYGTVFYEKYTLGRLIDFNTRCPLNNIYKRVGKLKKQ